MLRRRSRWLIVIGVAHAILLFYGDILAAYGLLALLLVPAIRWRDRRVLRHAAVWILFGALVYGFYAFPLPPDLVSDFSPWVVERNPVLAAGMRAMGIVVSAPALAITAAGAFLVGIWAARRQLLEEPARHRVLLKRVSMIGVPLSILGGLPLALIVIGVVAPEPELVVPFAALHAATGYAGGPAYAALIAL